MKDVDNVIRYIDGEMTSEDKRLFEQELVTSQSLGHYKNLIEEIELSLDYDDELTLTFKNKLKNTQELYNAIIETNYVIGSETDEPVITGNRSANWKMLAAAAVVLFVVITSVLYRTFSISSNDHIFSDLYLKYNTRMVIRTAQEADKSVLNSAIQWYNRNNYQAAINQLDKIIQSDPFSTAAHFYRGLSYIETKDYGKAIENFSFIINQNNSRYTENAQWYLALCYIKTNQTGSASIALNKIAAGNSYYKLKASDLLRKME